MTRSAVRGPQRRFHFEPPRQLYYGTACVRGGRFRGTLFGARVCLVSLVHRTKQTRQTRSPRRAAISHMLETVASSRDMLSRVGRWLLMA
jgi:hypothetical protein